MLRIKYIHKWETTINGLSDRKTKTQDSSTTEQALASSHHVVVLLFTWCIKDQGIQLCIISNLKTLPQYFDQKLLEITTGMKIYTLVNNDA